MGKVSCPCESGGGCDIRESKRGRRKGERFQQIILIFLGLPSPLKLHLGLLMIRVYFFLVAGGHNVGKIVGVALMLRW